MHNLRCPYVRPVFVSSLSVSILHIESIREGYQSEGLRKFGGSFPEGQCFTVVFRGKRKNLDLAAVSADEAQRWLRGLTKLMARAEAMSQREKLEQYPLKRLKGWQLLTYKAVT